MHQRCRKAINDGVPRFWRAHWMNTAPISIDQPILGDLGV
jgi:hypothetical protein